MRWRGTIIRHYVPSEVVRYIDEELAILECKLDDLREISKDRCSFIEHIALMVDSIPGSCLSESRNEIDRIVIEFRQAVRIWTSGDPNSRTHKIGSRKNRGPHLQSLKSLLASC